MATHLRVSVTDEDGLVLDHFSSKELLEEYQEEDPTSELEANDVAQYAFDMIKDTWRRIGNPKALKE